MSNKHLINDQFDVDLIQGHMEQVGPLMASAIKPSGGSALDTMVREMLSDVLRIITDSHWATHSMSSGVRSQEDRNWARGYADYLRKRCWSFARVAYAIAASEALKYTPFETREQWVHDVACMCSSELITVGIGANRFYKFYIMTE